MEREKRQAEQDPSQTEIFKTLCIRHGEKIQEKLSKANVAVAGLGGLGSNVAIQLARMGVGSLHLVDFDFVDLTNLNRQHYFIRHLGCPKTEALKEQIQQINPYLKVKTDFVKVTQENIRILFEKDELICEAFDQPDNKAMLVNGILEYFPEKKLVAASGMAGFGESNGIHTRRVTKNFYLCGDEHTEVIPGRGLMAPRVAICAGHEANMIVQLILEEDF